MIINYGYSTPKYLPQSSTVARTALLFPNHDFGSESIIDVCVTNVDCNTQRDKDTEKVLATHHERAKKKTYLESCLEQ